MDHVPALVDLVTAVTERKYALTRLSAGDYLLPSNDARTFWRIKRYPEGPSTGIMDWPRDREMWGYWKWDPRYGEMPTTVEDLDDHWRWDFWDGMCETRRAAIDAALRTAEREFGGVS